MTGGVRGEILGGPRLTVGGKRCMVELLVIIGFFLWCAYTAVFCGDRKVRRMYRAERRELRRKVKHLPK